MKMNSYMQALKGLYDANPKVFEEFVHAFSKDLGVDSAPAETFSFSCPNCKARIDIGVSRSGSSGRKARKGATGRRRPFSSGTLNPLILQLAKLKGVMVGRVHADFTKMLGKKARTLSKEQYRSQKESWLKNQIASLSRSKKSKAA